MLRVLLCNSLAVSLLVLSIGGSARAQWRRLPPTGQTLADPVAEDSFVAFARPEATAAVPDEPRALPALAASDSIFATNEIGASPFASASAAEPVPAGLYPATADTSADFRAGRHSWQLLPEGLIYRSYLAGAKESRFRSVWHHEKDEGWIWDIVLGGRVGLLRYGTTGHRRPEGFQIDIEGAGQPRLDAEEKRDVDAVDFRFGIPVTYGTRRYQMKFAYYHLSSHLGDEFLLKNPGFPRINFSRDVLVGGYSYHPTDELRLYAEAGWAFHADVSEPWEFQFGLDYMPSGWTSIWGRPFAAFNGHLREEVAFGGNFVVQAGWAWRGSEASGTYRMGVEYYNGENEQFSFFDEHENKIGLALWYDY